VISVAVAVAGIAVGVDVGAAVGDVVLVGVLQALSSIVRIRRRESRFMVTPWLWVMDLK